MGPRNRTVCGRCRSSNRYCRCYGNATPIDLGRLLPRRPQAWRAPWRGLPRGPGRGRRRGGASSPSEASGGGQPPSLARSAGNLGRPGDLSHATTLVVDDGLLDLALGVHDEGAVAGDGLTDGRSAEQEEAGGPRIAGRAPKPYRVAFAEESELPRP